MYISGNVSTFQSRQHQLITGASDYISFQQEFGTYSGIMDMAWVNKAQKEFISVSGRLKLPSGPAPAPYPEFVQISTCYDVPPDVTVTVDFSFSSMNGYPNGAYIEFQTTDPDMGMGGSWTAAGFGNTSLGASSFVHQYRGSNQGYDGTIGIRMRYNNGTTTGNWNTLLNQGLTC